MRSDKAVKRKKVGGDFSRKTISGKSPNINWTEVGRWYDLVQYAGRDWQSKKSQIRTEQPDLAKKDIDGFSNALEIDEDFDEA
ncbi:putative E3 ubiquitin-protein ligase, partial [Teratosphaeriaceae sp. CCFEE 6253]